MFHVGFAAGIKTCHQKNVASHVNLSCYNVAVLEMQSLVPKRNPSHAAVCNLRRDARLGRHHVC